ncbi:MAG TPA: hypothetical protein VH951_05950 [Dehalococcoidia bacterium]
MTANERSDEELHQLAIGGDAEAETELRNRFAPSLYDFALRVSLDPAVAEASIRAAFERPLDERPASLTLSTWFLSLVRDDILERMRDRGRGGDSADARTALSPVDPAFSTLADGSPGAGDTELGGWVWQAARAQRPRDYSLLDLSVRRGLSADEIAEAADMSHSGIYAILGRLRGFFEEAFAATLLYNRGRDGCPELAAIAQAHPALGPAGRREIGRHVEGCTACRQTRRSFPSPAEMLAAFVPVEAPQGVAPAPAAAEPAAIEQPAAELEPDSPLQTALPLAAAGLGAEAEVVLADQLLAPPEAPAAIGEPTTEAEIEAPTETQDEPEGLVDEAGAIAAEERGEVESGREAAAVAELPPAVETESGEGEVLEAAPAAAAPSPFEFEEISASAETIAFAPEVTEEQAVTDEEEFEDVAEDEEEDVYDDQAVPERGLVGADAGLPILAAPVAVDAAQDGAIIDERIRFARDRYLSGRGGGLPPRRPWDRARDWFDGQDRTRMLFTGLVIIAGALAVYFGLAIGNSIEGGNGTASGDSLAALPTSTPGIRQIVCGAGPSTVDQGSKVRLDFDKNALPGYQISTNLGIQPTSPTASAQSVNANVVPPLSVEFEAKTIAGTSNRSDEYHLLVTFTKAGERDIRSDCTIVVRAPSLASTAVPTAQATIAATATATTRPASTAAPATAIPPTDTPAPATATPTVASTSTPTRTPTATATRTPTP